MAVSKNRMLEGELVARADLTDACWNTPMGFVNLLTEKVGVNFPVKPGEDFLIYGFQTPGEDEKGKLWFRTDRADHFVGFFQFVNGKWQRIYDHSIQDVVWKTGDSTDIEPGFQLIDGTVASIPAAVQTHIMQYYLIDTVASIPPFTVYSYFATIYIGL